MAFKFNPFTGKLDYYLGYGALDGVYLRLDTTNDPLLNPLQVADGTAALPGLVFSGTTTTGLFRHSGNVMGIGVAGVQFVKIQPGPYRFGIGQGDFTLQATFHVEDGDAGIYLNRTAAAEAFVTCIVNGTGGAQMRGLVAGGVRWTNESATTEWARFNDVGEFLIGKTTATAQLDIQQRTGSTLDPVRIRSNTGLNFNMQTNGHLALGINDTGIMNDRGVIYTGQGNSGGANTTAALALGLGSAATHCQFVSTHHNGGSPAGNGFRFWTNNAVSAAVFPTDANICFSMFGQRAGVGLQTPDAVFDIENAANALGDLDDPTDYHLYLRNPADDTGEGIGIGFSIEATANFVGAAIIHERTAQGSQGHLNFYTKQTTGVADPVLVFRLMDNGVTHTLGEIEIDGDLNHDGSNIGFFSVAPAARTAAWTQTYATATRTQNNLTSQTLTDSTGGVASTTVVAIAGTGDDANINNNFADLIAQVNALIVDLTNVKQITNQIIDDQQTYGLFQ